MSALVALYRPQRTPLHRLPAAVKLLLLLTTSVASLLTTDAVTSVGLCGAALLLLISTVPPAKPTFKAMAFISLVALLSTGWQLYTGDYRAAVDISTDLITIAATALAVSASTPMSEMLDTFIFFLRPWRRILPTQLLAIMLALTIRVIPHLADLWQQSRTAARARGLDRSIRAVVAPAAVRAVGYALNLGQALHARGITDEPR